MRRRILIRLLLLLIVAIVGFLLLFWGMAPANFTSIEQFVMLRGGETEEEVEQVLGAPGIHKSGLPLALQGKVNVADASPGWKEWRVSDGQRIAVCFNKSGKVVATARFTETDTWLEKIRRWFR